jgi:hypothetical protein
MIIDDIETAYTVLIISAPKQIINALSIQARQDWNTPFLFFFITILSWEFLNDSVIPRIDRRAPPDPIYPSLTRAAEPS